MQAIWEIQMKRNQIRCLACLSEKPLWINKTKHSNYDIFWQTLNPKIHLTNYECPSWDQNKHWEKSVC